jgi:diguanylate cyclase (GGDEF)-like protein/PAS domain S-box-containing protein
LLVCSVSIGQAAGIASPLAFPSRECGTPWTQMTIHRNPVRPFIFVGVLLIAAVSLGTAVAMLQLRERALADSERELGNTALILAEQVDQSFHAVELLVASLIKPEQKIISSEDFEREMSTQPVRQLLSDPILAATHIDAIRLIAANGRTINQSQFWPPSDNNITDQRRFIAFSLDSALTSLVSEPVRNRATGAWTIFLCRKFSGPNGEFLGLAQAAVELAYFEKFFASIVLGDRSSIALLHSDGTVLARHPHVETAIGVQFRGAIDSLGQNKSAATRLADKLVGRDRLLVSHRLTHYPLLVTVGMDKAIALATWEHDAKILIVAAAFSALAFSALFLLIGQRLSQGDQRTKQQLAEEKLRLDTAVNNMTQGLLLFDSSERIVVTNKIYVEMYGLSPDVVKPGCSFRELILHRKQSGTFSGDVEEYRTKLMKNLAEGKATDLVITTPIGRTIRIVNQPLSSGGWVAMHEDITEHQNAERAARRLIETSIDLILVTDRHGNFVQVSPSSASIVGYQPTEMVGHCALEFIYPDDLEKTRSEMRAARLGERPRSFETRYFHKDGRVVTLACTGVWSAAEQQHFFIGRDMTERKQVEDALNDQKLKLDAALNNMLHGLCVFDANGRIVLFNQRYQQLMEEPAHYLTGLSLLELWKHRKATGKFVGDPEEVFANVVKRVSEGRTNTKVMERADGQALRVIDQPIQGGGWVATFEDITEQRKLEQERDRDREFLNQIIDNIPTMIAVKDARQRKFVLVNRAAETLWGISRSEAIGKTARDLFPATQADLIDRHDDKALESDVPLVLEAHPNMARSGDRKVVASKRLAIRDFEGKPQYLISVVEDVTEHSRANERIAHLAQHDALTDLPNRVLFREHLEQSLKWIHRGERLALLYLDIDEFKSVNDTLGHPIGDELLKAIAARLRACLRETDIVARLGGDEFAIIQSAIKDTTDVIELANRIHQTIREPYDVDGHQLRTDTSIGIALAPHDAIDPDQLLKNADLAMYRAKADGRGTFRFFEPDMDARVKARRAMEFDLREALMCGGFELHYQPLINLQEGGVSGFEALVRWRHPKRGLISPAEFIPVAEETGLINQLGEWVLRTACAEAATWPDEIKVAVNVSPVQFENGNLVQIVINALAASRLPARRLELEITEAVLIRDDAAVLALLHQLRALGIRIAMDDFGTGYSSLSYLQRFPFDKIKIDRSFVKDIAEPKGSHAIVQAVVGIAKSRNITTTAEGVETEQQLELLRALGCTETQGYLFSPARPAGEILALLPALHHRAAVA